MSGQPDDPHSFLPLPYLEFQVLVALADADLHGYAIVKDIARRCTTVRPPSTGSLYLAIARLLKSELIADVDADVDADADADAGADLAAARSASRTRRTYRLTGLGREVATAETQRLGALSRLARRRLGDQGVAGNGPSRG